MRDLVRTFGAYVLIRNLVSSRLVSGLTTRTGDGLCIYEAQTHTLPRGTLKLHEGCRKVRNGSNVFFV